jgi:hypothetical protein
VVGHYRTFASSVGIETKVLIDVTMVRCRHGSVFQLQDIRLAVGWDRRSEAKRRTATHQRGSPHAAGGHGAPSAVEGSTGGQDADPTNPCHKGRHDLPPAAKLRPAPVGIISRPGRGEIDRTSTHRSGDGHASQNIALGSDSPSLPRALHDPQPGQVVPPEHSDPALRKRKPVFMRSRQRLYRPPPRPC